VQPQEGYQQRLAELDAIVRRARIDPELTLERAAGLLAGRIGCPVRDAHAHLRSLAAERGSTPWELAEEVLAGLDAPVRAAPPRAPLAGIIGPPAARPDPPAGWTAVVQQLLDAVPGNHVLLLPLHDESGAVADFLIAAASRQAEDVSGRQAGDLVGRTARAAYPFTVDGPAWQASREVLADGKPRTVGPYPYAGTGDRVPAALTLTVWIRPVGAGLLNSWVRHDEQTRLVERIDQTERLANLGWGEWDLVTGETVWSDQLYRIYGRDPALGPMPRAETEALALPEDEPIRQHAADTFGRGGTADVSYRIRVGGGIRHIRVIGDAVRDAAGRPLRVYGIVQDVTAREAGRARLAQVEEQLRAQRQSLAAEHRLAAQLQQIILPIPAEPLDLPGLRVAVRYLPAEQAGRIGGDWYHAAARDGSVVFAVGDVAGHGIRAATAMAQLRYALHTLAATTTTEPARLLWHLNRLLCAEGPVEVTATAVVARYHPPTGTLVWAQAGHPAPLRAHAGTTTVLRRPAGPLLGAFPDARYDTASVTVDEGDLVVCYTDGLIEHRDHSLADGLARVIATLNRAIAAGQPLVDLLTQLPRANPDDDTCVLVARPTRTGDTA
jgi:serine phosphatase RsbU (regulator of sigma subunit)/PAS domain-containing protein